MKHGQRVLVAAIGIGLLVGTLALIAGGGPPALAQGDIIYVDVDAPGPTHDGSTWEYAYTGLQTALADAEAGDQIWVAEGTYKPSVEHGGSGDRYRSFQLMNGVALYGGFDPSVGDVAFEDRDWEANETILSGDLNGDDGPDFANNDENSYHVFFHPGTYLNSSAILDGCTITGGNANGTEPHDRGGGMYNANSSSLVLTNVIFSGNSASGSGGGMHNTGDAAPALTDCTFQSNTAGTEGGGIHNDGSSPTLTGCAFSENTADAGGAIYNGGSLPELIDCTFEGNSANSGGGMHNDGSSPVLINCTFEGNSAAGNGGGMRNTRDSLPTLTNCTFQGNRATNGGAMHNYLSSAPTVTNCILWGDSKPEIVNMEGSTALVTYSDVEGGYTYPGTGNINADPLFVDSGIGDFRLGPGSPCIDAGSNAAPNLPPYDFEGDPRILDGDRDGAPAVDMGVDEALWHPVYLPLVLRNY